MRDRNVISWAIISLVGFLVINFLMNQPFVKIGSVTNDFGKTSILALVLYAVPIVLAVLDWKPSFYLLGLVIVLYSLGLLGMLFVMWGTSHASMTIRLLMSAFSIGMLVANAYWLVLALRLRKSERDGRDRRRFGE
ncbi:hypothetical protein [Levilactobacillus acidifarinae]|uniref:Uncharacterized protein n=1 Tax=Levilactobacillus acidifarinae DSM 19394 = JCM 15949 TaxID=1423715 RepID=A0A0R1LIB9_9LACO|nr:hypothetical protein [Levilactobacillus acidifarinae]KRK95676.1 hypothetical protein FD25_GL000091 [Levilactobacillus acidifarinae DSM 19394]GEO69412.1 hypothetical protein LAC03_13220 [Levilactobacillus acidifarinae]